MRPIVRILRSIALAPNRNRHEAKPRASKVQPGTHQSRENESAKLQGLAKPKFHRPAHRKPGPSGRFIPVSRFLDPQFLTLPEDLAGIKLWLPVCSPGLNWVQPQQPRSELGWPLVTSEA
jgi:hypothetical protein